MKTLVIGGTGTVGSEVVSGLLKQQTAVRVLTHTVNKLQHLPKSVEGFRADLDDPGSLPPAFKGIDGVFLLNTVGPNETDEGLCAVEAAKTAGVKKIVYLSVCMPEGSAIIPHFRSKLPVEKAVRESGIAYTILRPNNFFQNDYWLKDAIMKQGVYPQPVGGKGLNRVDVRDIAECAVNALVNSAFDGQVYEVHGPDTLTGEDMAAIYSRHLGWTIRYAGDNLDTWAAQAKGLMPDFMVADMRIMYRFFQENGMVAAKEELERIQTILGRKPRTFDAFVKEIAAIWKARSERAA